MLLPARKLPWNDRAGRLSPLKLASLVLLLAPAAWIATQAIFGWLGSKPLTEANHQSGDWAVRLLLISLAVTPLRHVANWPQLIHIRRQIGLAALFYTLLHVFLYVALEAFDLTKVVVEIAVRPYLTIGFAALLGLVVLGLTSSDAVIRNLGALRWNRLHSIVYALAILALVHFALQKKIDVTEPAMMAGFFVWLMGFRSMRKRDIGLNSLNLLALALVVGLATVAMEAGWYATMTGVPWRRVLAANLDFSFSIRPAWWVLLAAVGMAALALVRTGFAGRPQRERRLAPATARTPYPET